MNNTYWLYWPSTCKTMCSKTKTLYNTCFAYHSHLIENQQCRSFCFPLSSSLLLSSLLISIQGGMHLIMGLPRTKLRTLIDMEEGIVGSLMTNLRNRSLSHCFNKFCFHFNCNLQIIFNYSTSFFHSQPWPRLLNH